MKAFLYLNLSEAAAYHNPLLQLLRQRLPNAAVLDLDLHSDEVLRYYALRMLREATRAAILLRAETETDLHPLMPLLEVLFEENHERLILLQGAHSRLQRMFAARPQVQFMVVRAEEAGQVVAQFLQQGATAV